MGVAPKNNYFTLLNMYDLASDKDPNDADAGIPKDDLLDDEGEGEDAEEDLDSWEMEADLEE